MNTPLFARVSTLFRFLNRTDGSLRNKILRSGFWQGLTSVGVNGLTLVKSVLLARLLSPEAFGLMSLCLMTIRGAQLITDTGFGSALIQRRGSFDEAKDTAFTLMAIRGVVLGILMIPIAWGLSVFYEQPLLLPLTAACGLMFLFSGFVNVHLTAALRELDFKKIAIVENAASIVSFVVALLIAYAYKSVWALVISFLLSAAVKTLLSYTLIDERPSFKIDRAIARELFTYGKFITGSTILLFVATEIDTAVVGKLLSVEALGAYSVAFLLANFPAVHVAYVISIVMFPAYSKIQDNPRLMQETFANVTNLVGSIVLPVLAGMAVAADTLIRTLYGERWLMAIAPFQILCGFGGLHAIVTVNGYMFNAIGKPDIGLRIAMLRLGGIAFLIVPAVQAFGLPGAATAMTAVMACALAYGLKLVMRILRLNLRDVLVPLLPAIVKSAVVAVAIVIARQFLPSGSTFELAWVIAAAAIVYVPLNVSLVKQLIKPS